MPELKLPELIIILVILLLLFGAKKLPQLSKSIGTSVKELRNSMRSKDDGATTPAHEDGSKNE